MKSPVIAALAAVALTLSACSGLPGMGQQPVGDSLGQLQYLVDLDPDPQAANDVHVDADIQAYADALATAYQAPTLADAVRRVDPDNAVVVALYFDACDKNGPSLYLDGDEVRVRYAETIDRACARAVDTLAVFEVPTADLPDPVHFALCGPDPITIRDGVKSGEIAYRMC